MWITSTSFNVWVRYFVWNFKGYLWNSTQISYPYIDRYDFYTTLKFLELLDLRAHTRFWNAPQVNDRCRNVKFKISNYKILRISQAISQTSSGNIWGLDTLTHWSPNQFLWMKIFVYLFKCHWDLSVALGAIDSASVGSGNGLVPSATDVNQQLRPSYG